MPDLDDLVAISQYAGRDVLLAQGGGGNTSVKSPDGARMWIKASGLRLAQVRPGYGCLETDVAALLVLLDDPALAAMPRQQAHATAVERTQAATLGAPSLRPSLETTFHAVLGRLVLHTHPVYVNAFACMVNGAEALAAALPQPVPWVPYATPGYALGVAVAQIGRAWQAQHGQPAAHLMLANHGLITSGNTVSATIQATGHFTRTARDYFGPLPADACDIVAPPPALTVWAEALHAALAQRYALSPAAFSVRPVTRAALLQAASLPDPWLRAGALVPDDVVYGGHQVWSALPQQRPADWLDQTPQAWPQTGKLIVAVPGQGVILAGSSPAFLEAMEENLLAHVLIRRLIARRGLARSLPPAEVSYLLSMESEKYRQAIAAAPPQHPPDPKGFVLQPPCA